MSVLKYRCPRTHQEVETSIETDDRTLKKMPSMKLSVWCPHCATSHAIGADQAYVDVAASIGLTGLSV
jgi:hypothetical protein